MEKIKIITGSQASISKELAEEYNISIIPYYLNYPNESLKEGVDIAPEAFYKQLADIDSLPSTSPPSIADIQAVIDSLKPRYSHLILISLSSKYSNMHQSCKQVALSESKVHVVDSQGATGYQAMMALTAAQKVQEGKSFAEVIQFIEDFKDRSDEFLVFDTLKYLAKGGRIGRVKAMMGSLLSIKPVVVHRDGLTTPLTRVRTNPQGLSLMIDLIKKRVKEQPDGKLYVMIQGIDVDEWLSHVKDVLTKEFKITKLLHSRLSAITSIHTGPKTWSLTYSIL